MLIVNALGGLALFLFGMKLMSSGLQKAAGEKMRTVLRFFSSNRVAGVLSGTVVTSVVQSSSVTTVMVIGFINAGLLTLQQSIGIIFGANIGTTITAQLVAFKIGVIIMPAIILGLGMSFFKNSKVAQIGETILGLGLLFFGMEIMGSELKQLAKFPAFVSAFQTFQCNPVHGVIPIGSLLGAIGIGLFATTIIQSSSACIGIVIALSGSGLLNLYTAVGIVLGTEIGTTVTAQLAALAANRVARQAALSHTLFNVIGVLLAIVSFSIPWGSEPVFFHMVHWLSANGTLQREIANAHTAFNVITTLILIPFVPAFAKICEKIIPVADSEIKYKRLEPHLLRTPAIALAQTAASLNSMLKLATKMVDSVLNIYTDNDEENRAFIRNLDVRESEVDQQQHMISDYLTKLMLQTLNPQESRQIPLLLHCSNDAEKIGDYAVEIRKIVNDINSEKVKFSPAAEADLVTVQMLLNTLAAKTSALLTDYSASEFDFAKTCYQELLTSLENTELAHMSRVHETKCSLESGVLFMELLERIRKTARHLYNIAERAGNFYGKMTQSV